jgi:hypothetical protein
MLAANRQIVITEICFEDSLAIAFEQTRDAAPKHNDEIRASITICDSFH